MEGGEPDIPIYKVIECTGPTNTRVYKVAVYFRGKRLASSTGHSIQQAEMEAAKKALENSSELFPQLDYQKRVMAHSMKRQKGNPYDGDGKRICSASERRRTLRKMQEDDSNLPKQYRVRQKLSSINSNDTDDSSDSNAECSDSSESSNASQKDGKSKELNIDTQKSVHNHGKCSHDVTSNEEDEQMEMENELPNNEDNIKFDTTIKNEEISLYEKAKEDISFNENEHEDEISDENDDTDVSLESGEIL